MEPYPTPREANPGTSFTASVNFGTSSYFRNTAANGTSDITQLTNTRMNSSISYGKVFADGKVNFTSSLRHDQNLATGDVSLELPQFSLNVSTFNPFDSKDRVGEQKWYQRITVGYSMQGRNFVSTKDTILFNGNFLNQFTNGFQHNIPVSLSLNVLKYFQFNTSMNYTERWYLQSVEKRLLNEINGYSTVRDTVQGFKRAYDYSVSSGLSTKVYGNFNKPIGKIQAMRHVMTPSINVNYRPDFAAPRYGYYRDFVDHNGAYSRYSIFENGIYGSHLKADPSVLASPQIIPWRLRLGMIRIQPERASRRSRFSGFILLRKLQCGCRFDETISNQFLRTYRPLRSESEYQL